MGFASRARRRARRARREPSVFFAAARVACVLAFVARAVARPANPVPNLPRQQRPPAGPPRRALAQATPSPAPPPPPHATVSTLADLRAHVASSSPTAVITLAASLDLGGDELPVVEKALEIRGACAPTACVLDAGAASRHLTVGVLGDLTLVDVVLARGVAVGLPRSDGGAVFVYGALVARRVVFSDNRADVDGPSGGGAVAVHHGRALFENCAFARNEASMDGGAVKVIVGTAEARDSSFDANVAGGVGAGVAVVSGAAFVRDCVFADDNDAREADSRDVHADFGAAAYLQPYDDSYRAGGEGVIDRAPALPPPPGADPSAFPPPAPGADDAGADDAGADDEGADDEGADDEGAVLRGVPIEGVAGGGGGGVRGDRGVGANPLASTRRRARVRVGRREGETG